MTTGAGAGAAGGMTVGAGWAGDGSIGVPMPFAHAADIAKALDVSRTPAKPAFLIAFMMELSPDRGLGRPDIFGLVAVTLRGCPGCRRTQIMREPLKRMWGSCNRGPDHRLV